MSSFGVTASVTSMVGASEDLTDEGISNVPKSIRWSIILVLSSATFLQRFGLNLGFYGIEASLFAQYILLGSLLLAGSVRAEPLRIVFFMAILIIAFCSTLLNLQVTSPTSLMLLLVLYTPFIFSIAPASNIPEIWVWTVKINSNIALMCAFAGIVQFILQFYIHESWLFDFHGVIPPILDGKGDKALYNTAIPVNSLFKSNGFFFVEPSFFSQAIVIALICEIVMFKRYIRICILCLALLLSYSGTGLLVIVIAFLFPLRVKTLLRLVIIGAAGLFVFFTLGDILNLSFTINRISEFNSEGSSAYARFVSPFELLRVGLYLNLWSPLFGNGPGTISEATRSYSAYNMFDPTWAKIIFEYGFLGFAALLSFLFYTTNSISRTAELRASLFATWLLMGGYLLTAEKTSTLYVLAAMWPKVTSTELVQVKKPID